MKHLNTTSSANQNSTAYDQNYKDAQNYEDFKPSSMAHRILEWLLLAGWRHKLLDISCGEGATAIFLAKLGYDVTAFDLSIVGVEKTKASTLEAEVNIKIFHAG